MSRTLDNERLDRRLAYYTVAAGAGMIAGSASAAPVNANINITVTAEEGGFEFESFDVDGDSNLDFQLQVSLGSSDGYGGYCGEVVLSAQNESGWTAYAQPITPGTQIDETFDYTGYNWLYEGCPFSEPGFFDLNERGFIGFRIPAGVVPTGEQAGSWHYGYMDVEVAEGSLSGIIHEVWYEATPDTPITVPRGTPEINFRSVPVGGALPLGLLIFAAGAAALRRRNRSEI